MRSIFQNPRPLNEIRNYKIKQDDYRYLFKVPIDIRFVKIEHLFRNFKNIAGDYELVDSQISPLICTWYMFFKYFRCKVIEESDPCFFKLYQKPDERLVLKEGAPVSWKLYQYSGKSDLESEVKEDFFDIIPEEYHSGIIKFLESIWEDYFLPAMPILQNQVLVFSIENYDIHVYTLGDIASYRYKESKRVVLHIPEYASVKAGEYCIDY